MAEQIARPHPARQKRVERVLREDVCSFPAGPVSELSSLPADALAHTISTASPREFVVMEEFNQEILPNLPRFTTFGAERAMP